MKNICMMELSIECMSINRFGLTKIKNRDIRNVIKLFKLDILKSKKDIETLKKDKIINKNNKD